MNQETLAYLGDNKEVHLLNYDGVPRQLTYPLTFGETAPCLWPTWSHNSEWLAYFQASTDTAPARLCITQTQGIQMRVLAEFVDRMPIYVYWSPTDDSLAVVEQTPDGVELLVYFLDDRDPMQLDDGAPIFFDWSSDGQSLIAHVVSPLRQCSRLHQYFLNPNQDDVVLSEETGGFAVPIIMEDSVIYAERINGMTVLKSMSLSTYDAEILGQFDGILGMQLRPNQTELALSISNPEGGLYTVELMDLNTRTHRQIATESDPNISIQSMFWLENGQSLLMTVVNATQRWLEWQYWDGENHTVINQFLPAREQLFYLHFYEQFSKSHNLISNNGDFYFAAYEPPHRRTEFPPKPWIFKGCLQPKYEFEKVQVGLFPALSSSRTSQSC